MRVLIADDHAVVRRGLREILTEEILNIGFSEAGSPEEVLDQLAQTTYALLLLDIAMPGRSGLDLLSEIRKVSPGLPVIVVSVQPEEQYAMRCLRAGAAAYIHKDCAPEELVQATRTVIEGGHYINSRLAELLLKRCYDRVDPQVHELLSNREYEIMRMIVAGRSLGEMAQCLKISLKTINTHRARIFKKMNVTSDAALIRYALQNRLME